LLRVNLSRIAAPPICCSRENRGTAHYGVPLHEASEAAQERKALVPW